MDLKFGKQWKVTKATDTVHSVKTPNGELRDWSLLMPGTGVEGI